MGNHVHCRLSQALASPTPLLWVKARFFLGGDTDWCVVLLCEVRGRASLEAAPSTYPQRGGRGKELLFVERRTVLPCELHGRAKSLVFFSCLFFFFHLSSFSAIIGVISCVVWLTFVSLFSFVDVTVRFIRGLRAVVSHLRIAFTSSVQYCQCHSSELAFATSFQGVLYTRP